MKLALSSFLLLFLPNSCQTQCPNLIWSDEFDGTELDRTKWSYEVGDGCDKGVGMCGWGNNEWQYYTGDGSNVEVSDGTLKIIAKKHSSGNPCEGVVCPMDQICGNLGVCFEPFCFEDADCPDNFACDIIDRRQLQEAPPPGILGEEAGAAPQESHQGICARVQPPPDSSSTHSYTSARIHSLGKAEFDMSLPLRIEASMKVPKDGKGLWPAFWMMPSLMDLSSWPSGGEIDIMEFIGKEPNQTYGVLHYGKNWGDKSQKPALVEFPENAGEYFHYFALEKRPNSMTWSVNGQSFLSLTPQDIEPKFDWPFESVFYFILNMAVGGNWPEYPDETTVFPSSLEIDYIRVYDISDEYFSPQIIGETLVHQNDQSVKYCVDAGSLTPHNDYDSYIEWYVPPGASWVDVQDQDNCILVDFGTESGYLEAVIYFNCDRSYELWLPIQVQDYYGISYRFWAGSSQAQYLSSTGAYAETRNGDNPTSPATITYQRNQLEVYDHIIYSTDAINNPQRYVDGARKFYMNALSPTAAPCTQFWIQLEDSSLATPGNYPTGRHSRYLAFLAKDGVNYQTLEFDFYDKPDTSVTKVNQIVILIDSNVQRSDIYYLRDFFQTSAGCNPIDNNCMPLLTDNTCQVAAKSEAGMCTDGFNNDGVGWNGDQTTDCMDSDCFGLDPACMATTPAPTPAVEICDDGVDNDQNGFTDCDDLACADSPLCNSWWKPSCDAYSACAELGLAGHCCPTPLGDYLDCCGEDIETPASCSVHPQCAALGHTDGACCPTPDGVHLDCCQPELCVTNPKCSGLEGVCCPTQEGVFLECCEERPESCQIHPQCDQLGLTGECCPTAEGVFLDCCEPRACAVHPACTANNLADDCCPTADGIFLDCCELDMPFFAGFFDTAVVGKSGQSP